MRCACGRSSTRLNHAYVTPGVVPPGAFRSEDIPVSDDAGASVIGPPTRPAFPRWARLHEDRARSRSVILAPERAYEIDAIVARGA